ncbi:N-succinylarginine dihydrolase [Cupriavidus sp. USMAHM13]|uniref:N-succinylarginine dihydrolase n=1 Tax=Cupriavidus sp. USMAHM13 TaxID=1389192 RepID=UPI0009F51122|nr:N-succinylarginine dihydrolase [Cupriavidus sp. USMAHM13]
MDKTSHARPGAAAAGAGAPGHDAGVREVNFDGLAGPTHHFAGLASGNVASMQSAGSAANPRQAALQGLAKMLALHRRGVAQAVLPPLARPNLAWLRALGFAGTDAEVIGHAGRQEPRLLSAAYSASSMWTANAATVSPAADCADGRVHFTPANLSAKLHRASEHADTARLLRRIFHDARHFAVHDALPCAASLGDEGAANHTRFAPRHGAPGVELFVDGGDAFAAPAAPARFAPRQFAQASRAVARLHRLDPSRTIHARQAQAAIEAGVFHNDVIAVGHLDTLLYHAAAFEQEGLLIDSLQRACGAAGFALHCIRVSEAELSLDDAVSTYLFNSQLLCDPAGRRLMVVPAECLEHGACRRYLDRLAGAGGPIAEVLAFDLRESMRNGGGPACLRLRVVLDDAQLASLDSRVLFSEPLHDELAAWVRRHYRDRLVADDLRDPRLLDEVHSALLELEGILRLPGFYAIG